MTKKYSKQHSTNVIPITEIFPNCSYITFMVFANRKDAGQKLAQALDKYRGQNMVVYALPRGGVVLGAEIAKYLSAPLDLLIIRKIGHPLQPEYAICAVSENGRLVCNKEEAALVGKDWLKSEVDLQVKEAKRRQQVYLEGRQLAEVKGKTAIIVDDGIATGLTMEAAIEETKERRPKEIIVAIPVIPKEVAEKLRAKVDKVIALDEPEEFLGAVGAYYASFPQVSDSEVKDLLRSVNHYAA